MKRWHEEYARTRTQWKFHHRDHVEMNVEQFGPNVELYNDIWKIDCPCDTQVGRFRKMKGRGCPNKNCNCKAHKHWGTVESRKTFAEKKADLLFREGLVELEKATDYSWF